MIVSYDKDKDLENFLKGLRSNNNPTPTKLHQEFFEKHGKALDEHVLADFLGEKARATNIHTKTREINFVWQKIGEEFTHRTEEFFGMTLLPVRAFVTTNQRCTYNVSERYFFIYAESKSPANILMHELLHFYTHDAFYEKLIATGTSAQEFNDIKESLTELLNVEFVDLMGVAIDKGYPQHALMRTRVRHLWQESRDMAKVVDGLLTK